MTLRVEAEAKLDAREYVPVEQLTMMPEDDGHVRPPPSSRKEPLPRKEQLPVPLRAIPATRIISP